MNNFEWIKSLPIEAMAEFLAVVTQEPCKLCDAELCRKDYECSYGWHIWLQKEKDELKKREITKGKYENR